MSRTRLDGRLAQLDRPPNFLVIRCPVRVGGEPDLPRRPGRELDTGKYHDAFLSFNWETVCTEDSNGLKALSTVKFDGTAQVFPPDPEDQSFQTGRAPLRPGRVSDDSGP